MAKSHSTQRWVPKVFYQFRRLIFFPIPVDHYQVWKVLLEDRQNEQKTPQIQHRNGGEIKRNREPGIEWRNRRLKHKLIFPFSLFNNHKVEKKISFTFKNTQSENFQSETALTKIPKGNEIPFRKLMQLKTNSFKEFSTPINFLLISNRKKIL